jgi:hypothetical protein
LDYTESDAFDFLIEALLQVPGASTEDDFQSFRYKTDFKLTVEDNMYYFLSLDDVYVNDEQIMGFVDSLRFNEQSGVYDVNFAEVVNGASANELIAQASLDLSAVDTDVALGLCVVANVATGDFETFEIEKQDKLLNSNVCAHVNKTSATASIASVDAGIIVAGEPIFNSDVFLTGGYPAGANWLRKVFQDSELYVRVDDGTDMLFGVAGKIGMGTSAGGWEPYEGKLALVTSSWTATPEFELTVVGSTSGTLGTTSDQTLGVAFGVTGDCDEEKCPGVSCKSGIAVEASLKQTFGSALDSYGVVGSLNTVNDVVGGGTCASAEAGATIATANFFASRAFDATTDKYVGVASVADTESTLLALMGLFEDTGSEGKMAVRVRQDTSATADLFYMGGILDKADDIFTGDVEFTVPADSEDPESTDDTKINLGVAISDGFVDKADDAGVERMIGGVAVDIPDAAGISASVYVDIGPIWSDMDGMLPFTIPQPAGLGLSSQVYGMTEAGARDTTNKMVDALTAARLPFDTVAPAPPPALTSGFSIAQTLPTEAITLLGSMTISSPEFTATTLTAPTDDTLLSGISKKTPVGVPSTSFNTWNAHKTLPSVPALPLGYYVADEEADGAAAGAPAPGVPAPTATPTAAPTVAPTPPPVLETTVDLELTMDPETFDPAQLAAAIATQSGVDASEVEIERVDFEVEVAYQFNADITESQATTVVAKANGVDESAVTVTISSARRLRSGERRLQSTTVEAKIVTTDQALATQVMAKNTGGGTEALADMAAVLQADFGVTATAVQTKAPVAKAKPVIKITTDVSAAAPVISSEDTSFSEAIATATGAEVTVGEVTQVTSTFPAQDLVDENQQGAATPAAAVSAVSMCVAALAMLAASGQVI